MASAGSRSDVSSARNQSRSSGGPDTVSAVVSREFTDVLLVGLALPPCVAHPGQHLWWHLVEWQDKIAAHGPFFQEFWAVALGVVLFWRNLLLANERLLNLLATRRRQGHDEMSTVEVELRGTVVRESGRIPSRTQMSSLFMLTTMPSPEHPQRIVPTAFGP